MNERIKELADQAGFNHMGIGLIIGIEEYHQKFAELIVRECLNMCADSDAALQRIRDGENPPNWKYIRYHASDSEWAEAYMNRFEHYESIANSIDSAGDKIKQHFGVEE